MRINTLCTGELYELPLVQEQSRCRLSRTAISRLYAVGTDVMVVVSQDSQETVGDALRVRCMSLDLLAEAKINPLRRYSAAKTKYQNSVFPEQVDMSSCI